MTFPTQAKPGFMRRIRNKVDQYLLIHYPMLWRSHLHITLLNPAIFLILVGFVALILLIPILSQDALRIISMPLYGLGQFFYVFLVPLTFIIVIYFRYETINTLFNGKNSEDVCTGFDSLQEEIWLNGAYFLSLLIIGLVSFLPLTTAFLAHKQIAINNSAVFQHKEDILKGYALIEEGKTDRPTYSFLEDKEKYGVDIEGISPDRADYYKEVYYEHRETLIYLFEGAETEQRIRSKTPLLQLYDKHAVLYNNYNGILTNFWSLLFLVITYASFSLLAGFKMPKYKNKDSTVFGFLSIFICPALLIFIDMSQCSNMIFVLLGLCILLGLFSYNRNLFFIAYFLLPQIVVMLFLATSYPIEPSSKVIKILGFSAPIVYLIVYTLLKPKLNRLVFQPIG